MLGIERFRHVLLTSNVAECGGLFDKDRFFDFRRSDHAAYTGTASRLTGSKEATAKDGQLAPASGWPQRLYDDAHAKYDDAFYVGDKFPILYHRVRFLRETFPGCKVVFLLRDPIAVGMSWQVRADNPASRWPRRNGFAAAIGEWNKALKTTMLAKTTLDRDLIVVRFEDMFANTGLPRLLSRLDLDGGEMGDVSSFVKRWQRTVGRDSRASPVQSRYAKEHADYDTYEWFKKEALT